MKIRNALTAALIMQLAACASSTAPSTTSTTEAVVTTDTTVGEVTTSTTAAETTTTAASVPLIRVEGGVKTEGLDTLSVRVGERVVFDVVADVSDEVHVHGYDLQFEVAPGDVTRVDFLADSTGIFEVELEAAAIPLVDLEVTP